MAGPSEADRDGWRREWLYCLGRFADLPAQQAQWLDPQEANPHHTFVELLCSYFDDLLGGEPDYSMVLAEGLVTPPEAEAVAHFHDCVSDYHSPAGDYDHRAILQDPAWHAVVDAAALALAALPFALVGR